MTPTHDSDRTGEDREFEHSLIVAIHEASPDGILVVNDKEMVVSHNLRFFEVFGIPRDDTPDGRLGLLSTQSERPLLAQALDLVKHPDDFLRRVHALYANPQLDDLSEIEMKDGRTLERHSTALWGNNRRYLGRVWFFRDITARKQLERALLEISRQDSLTGVANRRFFFERAVEELARARRFDRQLSFIMLDIDDFKRINDCWGHAAGDKVLKNLCACAKSLLRQVDLFARVGGEEFAVLVPDTGPDGAFELAERLRRNIEAQAVAAGDDTMPYTISAGVAALASGDASAESVLQRADAALYAAKRAGRNRTLRSGDAGTADG